MLQNLPIIKFFFKKKVKDRMANVGPSCRINTCISDRVEYRCYCFYNRREATMFSCSDHSRPSTWRRTCGYTEKYCRVCRLGGTFYFLLSFYSILYKLSSTTTCQMSHNSGFIDKKWYCYCLLPIAIAIAIHGGSCVTIHIFF